jgi:hypothetical protein
MDMVGRSFPRLVVLAVLSVGCWVTEEDRAAWLVQSGDSGLTGDVTGSGHTWTHVDLGYGSLACGTTTGDELLCWDATGDPLSWFSESNARTGSFWRVGVGNNKACAVKDIGAISCWSNSEEAMTPPSSGSYEVLSVGGNSACAISSEHDLKCWTPYEDDVVDEAPSGAYTALALSSDDAVAIDTNGELACWGEWCIASQLPSGPFDAVAVGGAACAWETGGAPVCWRKGSSNLYDAVIDSLPGPYTAIAISNYAACGSLLDGGIECWGDDFWDSGALEPPAGQFQHIAAGEAAERFCAVRSDGALKCWGDDFGGFQPPSP